MALGHECQDDAWQWASVGPRRVEKPGSDKLTPGLPGLGAVAAAKGVAFAADSRAVGVTYTGKQQEELSHLGDLERIETGKGPASPVQEGGVIDVACSAPKLVPYGL